MARSTNTRHPLPVTSISGTVGADAAGTTVGGTGGSASASGGANSGSRSPFTTLSTGEAEVIGIFVQISQAVGAPRSLGEIYGLLFATPDPLSFQDIADRLKLSKGSVSQGLRFLRTIGAIKPVVIAGDRREFFEPVVELRALVGGFLRERLNPQIENWGVRAKALKLNAFDVGNLSEASLETLDGRLDKLKTWQKRAALVLPMVSKLLG